MFGKDLQKEIYISSREDCLIYKVEVDVSQAAKVIKLRVEAGCQAAAYSNGQLIGTYEPKKDAWEIDLKKAKRSNDIVTIVGINIGRQFKILFGIGGIPFKDREAKLDVPVGLHGECNCRLIDGTKIYTDLGVDREKVTVEDVREKIEAGLKTIVTSEFANNLDKYTYHTIFGTLSELSGSVKKQSYEAFNKDGIELIDCFIEGIGFPEDYLEKREKAIKEKSDKIYQPIPAGDDELLNTILQNRDKEQEKKEHVTNKCPHCKKENDPKSKFCKFCGRKLNK